MKAIYIVIFTILLGATNALAQFSISGTVNYKEDNTPLKEVSISILDLNKIITTDSTGKFSFTNLNKGNYRLQFFKPGYKSHIEIIKLTDNIIINIPLLKYSLEMEDVVITGTSPSTSDKSPVPIIILNKDDVNAAGSQTIMESLAKLPGVSQITTGNGVGRPVIRGMSGTRIVTVANGIKVENQQWDPEHTLGLNQFGIERVEVIKGPAGLLYGPEAMGGVLNFIDEKPAPTGTISGELNLSGASNNLGYVVDLGVRGATEKFHWSLNGGTNFFSDYSGGSNDKGDREATRVANSRFGEDMIKATAGYTLKNLATEFTYQFSDGQYGIVEPFEKKVAGGKEEEAYPYEFETPYHTYQHQMSVLKNTIFAGKTKVKINLGFQDNVRHENEPVDTVADKPSYLGFHEQTFSYDARWEIPLAKSSLIAVGSQGESLQNTNTGYHRLIPNATQQDIGFFAFERTDIAKLRTEVGIRYDMRQVKTDEYNPLGSVDSPDYLVAVNKTFSNFSGSASAIYEFGEHFSLRGIASNGFRAPNFAELTTNGVALETQHYELGNPDFKKETNMQFELDPIFETNNFRFEVSAFYNIIQNYITLNPTAARRSGTVAGLDSVPVYQYIQQDATIYGLEYNLDWRPKFAKWLDISNSFSMLIGKSKDSGYLPFMPAPKFNTGLKFSTGNMGKIRKTFFRVNVTDVLAQDQPATHELSTPAYDLFGLTLGGTIKVFKNDMEIVLGVNNIRDTKYYDHLSRLRQYGVYNMGRNIYVSLRYPFKIKG